MSDEKVVGPREIAEAYSLLAASEEGQIVIHDLARRFGYTRGGLFQQNECDGGRGLAFREGQREVIAYIGKMIDVDPAEYAAAHSQESET